jgi:hypothetical protein
MDGKRSYFSRELSKITTLKLIYEFRDFEVAQTSLTMWPCSVVEESKDRRK